LPPRVSFNPIRFKNRTAGLPQISTGHPRGGLFELVPTLPQQLTEYISVLRRVVDQLLKTKPLFFGQYIEHLRLELYSKRLGSGYGFIHNLFVFRVFRCQFFSRAFNIYDVPCAALSVDFGKEFVRKVYMRLRIFFESILEFGSEFLLDFFHSLFLRIGQIE
jgi:hypothetical protein